MACVLMKFQWAKPHNEFYIPMLEPISTDEANFLTLQSLFTEGRKGRTGTAGLSTLIVEYADGTREDLMVIGREIFPEKVARNGQLYFTEEYDYMDFPLEPGKMITAIIIKADSWIAPGTDAFLSMELENYEPEQPVLP